LDLGGGKFSKQAGGYQDQNRHSITRLILLFALLFLIICGIALAYYLSQVERIRVEKADELTSIAASKVNEIEAWRGERMGDGLRVQKNPLVYDSLLNYLNNPDDQTSKEEIVAWLENIRSANSYSTYYLLDGQGNILFKDMTHPEELDAEDTNLVRQAFANNQIILSDLHVVNDGKLIRLDLMAPVSGQFAHPIAVVVLSIDPYQFLYPLIQSWPLDSKTAETVLFRKEGDKVLYLNDLRFAPNSAMRLSFPLSSPDLPAAEALMGNSGPYEGVDYRGSKVLAVSTAIPNTDWYMIAKEDQSEIFAESAREGWVMAAVLVLALISILSLAFTLIRRQRQILVNQLLTSELEQQKIHQKFDLLFDQSNDIVIVFDDQGQITDANDRAYEAYGYAQDEFVQRNAEELIAPEFRSELNSYLTQIRAENGKRFEMRHLRKDGSIFPVEISSRYFEVESKGYYLNIIRDISEQKLNLDLLGISESKYRNLVEHAADGIFIADASGRFLDVNEQGYQMLGFTKDEYLKLSLSDIVAKEDQLAHPLQVKELTKTPNRMVVSERVIVRKDGSQLPVEIIAYGLPDNRMQGIVRDITDRVKQHKEVEDVAERYRQLFEFNPLPLYVYDTQTLNFLAVNDAAVRYYGFTKADFLGMKITAIEAVKIPVVEITGEQSSFGELIAFPTQHINQQGMIKDVEITSHSLLFNGHPASLELVVDVTEQKRTEAEIRGKQELLDMTGRVGKIGGWEIDVVKGTSSWTDEVSLIQDLDPKVPASVEFGYSFYSPESRPIIEKAVNEAIHDGKPYDLELEIITTKGAHKLIHTTGLPELKDGKVVRVAGIFQDITEIKKAEAEIKKLNDELEQRVKDRTAELSAANQELEAFSYSVSHDLRAPIRAIDGFSQIILEDFQKDINPDVQRYLEIIRTNTGNMGNLVDDLLAFSRLGRQALERQTVNTRRLVEEVVAEIKMGVPERQIEFKIGDLPDCQADVNLLKQVFINLISNAVKFTRHCDHAKVEIGASKQPASGNVQVVNKSNYCYYVRDNGVGFDMRYYDKLFGVFQRLHKAEDYEGTGVGLAIVKRVVEKHGGMVWAESQLNKGATFYFVLGEKNENGKPD
jgi:PAS domain S-box-containing protein